MHLQSHQALYFLSSSFKRSRIVRCRFRHSIGSIEAGFRFSRGPCHIWLIRPWLYGAWCVSKLILINLWPSIRTHFEYGLILNVKYIHIIFYHELLFLGVGRVLNFKDFFWTVRHCLNHPQGPYIHFALFLRNFTLFDRQMSGITSTCIMTYQRMLYIFAFIK